MALCRISGALGRHTINRERSHVSRRKRALSKLGYGSRDTRRASRAEDCAHRRMILMSLFDSSRFTAMLAIVAILGIAGSFWWAIVNRADLKSGASDRSADRASLSRPAARASRLKDERANKFASSVSGEQSQSTASDWSDDLDHLRDRSVPPRVFADNSKPSLQDRGADMPLPAPPTAQNDPEGRQSIPIAPQVTAPQSPGEDQKRQMQDPKPELAAAAPPKPAARSYYIEKIVEQGDVGDVKFRYRRQSCTPPNMPDVCFMPQENRRNIVVERR